MRTMWNVMKMLVLLVVLVVMIGGIDYMVRAGLQQESAQITFMDTQPVITELQKLAMLATMKVFVADVLQQNRTGFRRKIKGAWLIKGDALIGVDMAHAAIAVDVTNRHIDITLPQPCVSQPRLDHARTRTYDVQRGWFTPPEYESEVRDAAMAHGQQLVEHAAAVPENMQLAKEQTEELLTIVCKLAGYSASVRWQHTAEPVDVGSNAVWGVVQTATAMR